MVNVSKPFLPEYAEYEYYLKGIWERNWLTNHGPLVNELELKLKEYLKLDHLLFLNNGTIALQVALKALDVRGEVITTPFSYVATSSSIVWEGSKPVYVDIDPASLNIDPAKIEAAITPATTAILATHVYGNPCDIDAIDKIARRHKLKVIYDAAHCFGTLYKGKSVFEFGDISTASFHATKLFHSGEGGAVITRDPALLKKMGYLRNFGHETAESFALAGINGKNSELHAAMGLCVLKHIEAILADRERIWKVYTKALKNLKVETPRINPDGKWNHSYFPVVFRTEQELVKAVELLNKNYVFPRRYFYPSLNNLPYVDNRACPLSESISGRVLCLPAYYNLADEVIDMIARLLLRAQNN
jgi:dTDP-4-amino-4,6-dideoxygalactose transaminase